MKTFEENINEIEKVQNKWENYYDEDNNLCDKNGNIIEYDTKNEKDIYKPTYEEIVQQKIRARYSIDEELAIQRQRDTKPDEFQEYYNYCEQCKAEARVEVL